MSRVADASRQPTKKAARLTRDGPPCQYRGVGITPPASREPQLTAGTCDTERLPSLGPAPCRAVCTAPPLGSWPPRACAASFADFTYVATWRGVVYVAFVLDLFLRCIVGWRAHTMMRTDLVLNWVARLNQESLLPPLGYDPPAEFESQYFDTRHTHTSVGVLN